MLPQTSCFFEGSKETSGIRSVFVRFGARRTTPDRARGLGGFTLIELLVVIAIVGLLISLVLPGLAAARAMSKECRELASGRELMLAFTSYANTSKDAVLCGYPTRAMVSGPLVVHNDRGERLSGEVAQRYPWRLAPEFSYDLRGLYDNAQLLSEIRANEEAFRQAGVDYDYVVSLYPSLGMNVAFVGGSERFGAFDRLFRTRYGKTYIERLDEVRRPSTLITFASARGDTQNLAPQLGKPRGFFKIEPPRFTVETGPRWDGAFDPASESAGLNSGYVDLRHFKKSVAAHMDGHAEMLGWDALNDMRRWSDQATAADWSIGGG